MFGKLLSAFSIGSARIDTRLEKTSYMPGEQMRGQTFVFGGERTEKIEDISINISTRIFKRVNNEKRYWYSIFANYQITSTFSIQPKETKVFPFFITLPLNTPLTMFDQQVYVNTRLNVVMGGDPKDTDAIEIRPLPIMEAILYGMQYLGFYLVANICEYSPHFKHSGEFVQKIRFNPISGIYKNKLEKIDVIFLPNPPYYLDVVLEVDKDINGFLQDMLFFRSDSLSTSFQISGADLQKPVEYFAGLIANAINTVINANPK